MTTNYKVIAKTRCGTYATVEDATLALLWASRDDPKVTSMPSIIAIDRESGMGTGSGVQRSLNDTEQQASDAFMDATGDDLPAWRDPVEVDFYGMPETERARRARSGEQFDEAIPAGEAYPTDYEPTYRRLPMPSTDRSVRVIHTPHFKPHAPVSGIDHEWMRSEHLAQVVTAGARPSILGLIDADADDDAVIRAFAYAMDHRRHALTFVNVTRPNEASPTTRQIHVPWDHPVLIEERERRSDSLNRLAVDALLDDRAKGLLMDLFLRAAEVDAEGAAATEMGPRHFLLYASMLARRVNDVLAKNADSAGVRRAHGRFHNAYAAFCDTQEDGANYCASFDRMERYRE